MTKFSSLLSLAALSAALLVAGCTTPKQAETTAPPATGGYATPPTTSSTIVPGSAEELAGCLADAAAHHRRVTVCGNSTKDRMGGPISPSDVTISTRALNQVLEYNPRDLTISVGAGISYCELSSILAEHRQMIPLDPPFSEGAGISERATIGGIVAANTSGPRRRLYGSARDMVIGMTFATLEGKLIRTGGMVVKNVAAVPSGPTKLNGPLTLLEPATWN